MLCLLENCAGGGHNTGMENQKFRDMVVKLFWAGGWFPVGVFVGHLFLKFVVHIYWFWPRADMPLHFLGGMSIAYFVSGGWRFLSRQGAEPRQTALLELVLIVSLTATAAVFWEFGEFAGDQLFGFNLQVNLLNTMQDLILGMAGGFVIFFVRVWQLRRGIKDALAFVVELSC